MVHMLFFFFFFLNSKSQLQYKKLQYVTFAKKPFFVREHGNVDVPKINALFKNLTKKWIKQHTIGEVNFTKFNMWGFGLVSDVVKIFPVSSLSLARIRKSTRKKRARRAWTISSRVTVSSSNRTRHGRSHISWPKHRDATWDVSWSATRLAIARSIACTGQLPSDCPHQVRPDEETVMRLGIPCISSSGRVVLVSSWLIFSLMKENWQERASQPCTPAQILR